MISEGQPGRVHGMSWSLMRHVPCLLGALLLSAALATPTRAQTPVPPAALAAIDPADPGGKKLEAEINQRIAAEQARRRGSLGPGTRDPELAAYYNAFALRIECFSERSYPQAARGRSFAISVTLSVFADGRLEKTEIERSSGNPDVDAAVLAMVRSAAPYEAFSSAMAERYAVLDISSRWQFAYAKHQAGRVDQCRPGR